MPAIMNPCSLCSMEKQPLPYCDCMSICKSMTEKLRLVVNTYRTTCPDMISQLTSADYVMLLKYKTTTVGRTMDMVMPHNFFPAGTNSYISRKHFTIAYDPDGNFTLLCLSKNGVMIDEKFHRKREERYILPQHCIIRFPSTTDIIHFKSLIHETTIAPAASIGSICNHRSNNDSELAPVLLNEEMVTDTNCTERPPYSYSQLIIQAISSSPQKKLPLCKIYSFIMEKYPYYREFAIRSWQNSIRHNLSMKAYFLKTPQPEPNIGHLWMLRPSCEAHLLGKRFTGRRIRSPAKMISEIENQQVH